MTEPTIVLGWDGLDYELVQKFGLADDFGEEVTRIETFDNPVKGEPLTREIWPSIIAGEIPDVHGIHAETEDDGIDWDNPVIDAASDFAAGMVPKTVRLKIGHELRNRGARVKQQRAEYLDEQPAGTVFDGRDSVAISIPSYQTELDRQLDLVVDRTGIWHGVLHTVETEEGVVYEPDVSIGELDLRLVGKARRRYGYVEAAATQGHDLVMCWFGYLDTVGHLAPAVNSADWQRRHYARAAAWTRDLRERTDAIVLCVSDHGLRGGSHTHDATFSAPEGVALPETVLDVRKTIDSVTPRSGGETDGSLDGRELGAIDEQLEALGYISR